MDIQEILGKIYISLCPELQYTASHLISSGNAPIYENDIQGQGLVLDDLSMSRNVPPLDELSTIPSHMSVSAATTATTTATVVPIIAQKDALPHVEDVSSVLKSSVESSKPKSVIRLGFVSSHFSDHSIGRMMIELFAYIHRRHHPNDETAPFPTGDDSFGHYSYIPFSQPPPLLNNSLNVIYSTFHYTTSTHPPLNLALVLSPCPLTSILRYRHFVHPYRTHSILGRS